MLIKISICYIRKESNDSIKDLFAIIDINDMSELCNIIYYLEFYAKVANKYQCIIGTNQRVNFIVDKLPKVYSYKDFINYVKLKTKSKIKRVNNYQFVTTNDNIDTFIKEADIKNIKQITCLDDVQYVDINDNLKRNLFFYY